MGGSKNKSEDARIAFLFVLIPTLMLIINYFLFPYPETDVTVFFLLFPMFIAPILLGIGFFIKKQGISNNLKILGWMVFAFYWSTQPAKLYISEGGDVFNSGVCIIGVFVLSYIAYHEWLSIKRKEEISCLNWIAGAAFLAGIIYFGIERTPIELWLREVVAQHSGWFLEVVTGEIVHVGGENNLYITYKSGIVYLIFACTAVQAMVIFVGMILPLPKVGIKRKIVGLVITLIPVYILNFMRNAMVSFLIGNEIVDFNVAHNGIAKIGALITLIILLLLLIKLIPEILDEIFCLADLRKRDGPLEKTVLRFIRRKT